MNALESFVLNNKGRVVHKWRHYLEVYDRHLSRFRNQRVSILEIGIQHGGSLEMWKSYFGSGVSIYGVDVNPHCKELESEQVKVFIGDQEDTAFLADLRDSMPRLDIIIDDGGHTMKQQIATFRELFPQVAEGGVYLCEDIGTSYRRYSGGGSPGKRGTFIDLAKRLIDAQNAWFADEKCKAELPVTDQTRTLYSMHFYPGVLVIEKQERSAPAEIRTGTIELPADQYHNPLPNALPYRVRRFWRETVKTFNSK